MTDVSQTLLTDFQIRKSKKQKAAFRSWLCGELKKAGYDPVVDTSGGLLAGHTIILGNPARADMFFTAHYDTCAVLPFPNFITPRNLPVYLLYNLLICLVLFVVVIGAELPLLLLDLPKAVCEGVPIGIFCFFLWWMFFGKANRHTANDNTSGVVTLLEIAQILPPEDREKVCFIFFDNEEKGLLGSNSFASKHKDLKERAFMINFDCVGDGKSIQFFPNRTVKKDAELCRALEEAFLPMGDRSVEVVRGFGFYPSDNGSFKKGVGVCALKKAPFCGYYMDRIHTARDTVLEEDNIALLREGALRLAKRGLTEFRRKETEKRTNAG